MKAMHERGHYIPIYRTKPNLEPSLVCNICCSEMAVNTDLSSGIVRAVYAGESFSFETLTASLA